MVLALCMFGALAWPGATGWAQDIDSGLVGYWHFDGGTGADASGAGNDLIVPGGANAPAIGAGLGRFAGGAAFTAGEGDYLTANPAASLDLTSFTMAAWVRSVVTGGRQNIVEKGNDGGVEDFNYYLLLDSARFYECGFRGGGGWRDFGANAPAPDDVWHHVACTFDNVSKSMTIYIDGVSAGSGTLNYTPDVNDTALWVGRSGNWNSASLEGGLDEVRVYNRALSQLDITALVNFTAPPAGGACAGPAGDEGVMRFDPERKSLVYCDGENWIQMGEAEAEVTPADLGSVVPGGLLAHWKLDQASGTNAPDAAGSRNGMLSNMDDSDWIEAKFGKGLDFDGSNDFVSFATNIEFNSGDFSVAGWFKREGASGGPQDGFAIFSQRADAAANGSPTVNLMGQYGGKPVLQIRDNAGALVEAPGATSVLDNVWYHVVGVKTAAAAKIYVNGVLENSVGHSLSGDFDAGAVHRFIGRHRANGGDLTMSNGQIDDVRVYDRALSDADIQRLFYGLGEGCVDPEGDAGGLVYNSSVRTLQYCNGLRWIGLGGQGTGVYTPTGSGDINDAIPDGFDFADETNAALNTLITSAAITPAGYLAPASVSVTGGGSPQISINGGAWVTSGTIAPGQTIAVRLTSAGAVATNVSATVSIGGVSDVWNVMTAGADTTPDAFSFTDQTNVARSTLITSNTITINGINTTTPVSVTGTGAQISINGGGWITSGTITNGQTLGVRLTSSGSFNTAMTATVNVGGVTDVWSVTTLAADTTPDAFDFTPNVTNANLSTLTTAANTVTISGVNTSTPVSVTGAGAQVEINGSGTWVTSGTIQNGQTLKLRLTSSGSFSTMITATVTVGGVSDTWSVTTRAPNNCSAQSKTWLTNCTATVTAANHGNNGTGTITDPGGCGTVWYGSGTFACADGAFTYSSGSCTQQTACDTTPNAFTFTDVTGQALSTLITSNTVTIGGINTGTAVSVSGSGSPKISINGGAWVTSGTITNGQTLRVQLTSSASFSAALSATVNVGGVTDAWSVTTRAPNNCTVASGTTWTVSGKTCTSPSVLNVTHGSTGSRTDSTEPTTGSATWNCTDGTPAITASTCVESCAASQSVNWSPGCSASSGALLANGGNRSITNTAPGYTGTRDIQCNNGSLSQSGGSCAASGPTGCPSVGDACSDGSVFAGGDVYMAGSAQSTGIAWSSASIIETGAQSRTDGEANQSWIVANRTLSNYPAFEICNNLVLHGQSDWYLPARDEMSALNANRVALGLPSTAHWSSTQDDDLARTVAQREPAAWWIFVGGSPVERVNGNKQALRAVRCIRRQ